MYDMKPLEEKWKKYKYKKMRPIYIGVVFLCIIIILLFSVSDFRSINEYVNKFYGIISVKKKIESSELVNKVLLNHALYEIERSDTLEHKNTNILNKSSELLVDIPILDVNDVKITNIQENSVPTKISLDIVETSSISAYEDVEKRFAQSHDIDDALFLAKSYFKLAKYNKAMYWSYEVNKLDNNIEESILVFAQSKVYLGKKNEGLSILESYIGKSNSQKAKLILERIQNDDLH